MSNWLEKVLPGKTGSSNLPAKAALSSSLDTIRKLELTKGLPPATIVYGIAAGAFFAFALYLLVHGHWLDGFLTMLPGGCFVGFAVHLLKHSQMK